MNLKIKIKRVNLNAKLPSYGSNFAAGADLYACLEEEIEIGPGETKLIPTGIAAQLPSGTVGLVFARSGLASKQDLAPANKVGVIDSDYRGEIMVPIHNHGREKRVIQIGQRIAQMIVMPYYFADFEESGELEDSVRGVGGFGSTGL